MTLPSFPEATLAPDNAHTSDVRDKVSIQNPREHKTQGRHSTGPEDLIVTRYCDTLVRDREETESWEEGSDSKKHLPNKDKLRNKYVIL